MKRFTSNIRLACDLSAHLIFTSLLSLFVYLSFGNVYYVYLCFLGGIFIDLDHLIDYFLVYRFKFSFRNFMRRDFLKSRKVFLFLHSWELLVLIAAAGWYVNSVSLSILSLAMGAHLLIDYVQKRNHLFYFLLYRFTKGFDLNKLNPYWQEEIGNELPRSKLRGIKNFSKKGNAASCGE